MKISSFLSLFAFLFFVSCAFVGANEDQFADVPDSDLLFSNWKQISGYDGGNPSSVSLENNFNFLALFRNSDSCKVSIINKSTVELLQFRAIIEVDYGERTLSLEYYGNGVENTQGQELVRYSISRSGERPRLILNFSGSTQQYELLNNAGLNGDSSGCQPQQDESSLDNT